MTLKYLNYLCLVVSFASFAQSNTSKTFSKNVNLDLADVNYNLKTGIVSFDLESSQFNAKEAHKSIIKVVNSLEKGACKKAYNLAYEMKSEIEAALREDEHVHSKMYLDNAKQLINDVIYEYDSCITQGSGDEALTELEQKQANLRQQQLELEREGREIQKRLAEQREETQLVEKKQFIGVNITALQNTISAYNKALEACDCGSKIKNDIEVADQLTKKSLPEIKIHFLNKAKLVTSDYIAVLDACED